MHNFCLRGFLRVFIEAQDFLQVKRSIVQIGIAECSLVTTLSGHVLFFEEEKYQEKVSWKNFQLSEAILNAAPKKSIGAGQQL